MSEENKIRCKVCKRPLESVFSRMLGMGPSCAKKFVAQKFKYIDPNQLQFPGIDLVKVEAMNPTSPFELTGGIHDE